MTESSTASHFGELPRKMVKPSTGLPIASRFCNLTNNIVCLSLQIPNLCIRRLHQYFPKVGFLDLNCDTLTPIDLELAQLHCLPSLSTLILHNMTDECMAVLAKQFQYHGATPTLKTIWFRKNSNLTRTGIDHLSTMYLPNLWEINVVGRFQIGHVNGFYVNKPIYKKIKTLPTKKAFEYAVNQMVEFGNSMFASSSMFAFSTCQGKQENKQEDENDEFNPLL